MTIYDHAFKTPYQNNEWNQSNWIDTFAGILHGMGLVKISITEFKDNKFGISFFEENKTQANEVYVEIIWDLLKRNKPKLKRKKRQFSLKITHDVDDFKVGSFIKRVKLIFAQLFLHKSLLKFLKIWWVNTKWIFTFPKNSFKFINNISSKFGIKSIFYFLVVLK